MTASAGGELVRLNPDGSLDSTFGTDGVAAPLTITAAGQQVPLQVSSGSSFPLHSLALLPDGRILIAGDVTVPNVGHYTALAMCLPNGALDPSFNGDGTLFLPPDSGDSFQPNVVVNVAVSDNQILLFVTDQGTHSERLYQFQLDGTRNTSFGSNGEITLSGVGQNFGTGYIDPALAIEPDGKIILAYLNTPVTVLMGNETLLRYDSNGSPDSSFGTCWPGDRGEHHRFPLL